MHLCRVRSEDCLLSLVSFFAEMELSFPQCHCTVSYLAAGSKQHYFILCSLQFFASQFTFAKTYCISNIYLNLFAYLLHCRVTYNFCYKLLR